MWEKKNTDENVVQRDLNGDQDMNDTVPTWRAIWGEDGSLKDWTHEGW